MYCFSTLLLRLKEQGVWFVLLTEVICLTGLTHSGTVLNHPGVPNETELRGERSHIRTISCGIHPAFEKRSVLPFHMKAAFDFKKTINTCAPKIVHMLWITNRTSRCLILL